MFNFLKRKEDDTDILIRRMVEMMEERQKLELECKILHQALIDCCDELYKHTGKILECDPKFYINAVKNRYGYKE